MAQAGHSSSEGTGQGGDRTQQCRALPQALLLWCVLLGLGKEGLVCCSSTAPWVFGCNADVPKGGILAAQMGWCSVELGSLSITLLDHVPPRMSSLSLCEPGPGLVLPRGHAGAAAAGLHPLGLVHLNPPGVWGWLVPTVAVPGRAEPLGGHRALISCVLPLSSLWEMEQSEISQEFLHLYISSLSPQTCTDVPLKKRQTWGLFSF